MTHITDQLRETWVSEPPRLDGSVYLSQYDPDWPVQFEREAARIREVLGSTALAVEHVGSTAIPGLATKPRIDILLVVASSADETTYVPALEGAGYTLVIREPVWHEHRVFKGPGVDVNLHVLTLGCSDIERMVVFRDWLRARPDERDRYLQVKRELAARTWAYIQEYADAKGEVVDEILARAGAPPRNDSEVEGRQPVPMTTSTTATQALLAERRADPL
jgi:GrpB-like predicted nucleotidyltransferase (UPF0157 family)